MIPKVKIEINLKELYTKQSDCDNTILTCAELNDAIETIHNVNRHSERPKTGIVTKQKIEKPSTSKLWTQPNNSYLECRLTEKHYNKNIEQDGLNNMSTTQCHSEERKLQRSHTTIIDTRLTNRSKYKKNKRESQSNINTVFLSPDAVNLKSNFRFSFSEVPQEL